MGGRCHWRKSRGAHHTDKLRRANIDAAAGAVEEVARIVAQIRRRWPLVRILLVRETGSMVRPR
jgi:hypothetical protein